MTLVHMLVAVVGEQRDQGTWRRGSLREEARGSSMVLIGRADWRPRGALSCLGTRSVARGQWTGRSDGDACRRDGEMVEHGGVVEDCVEEGECGPGRISRAIMCYVRREMWE
jgi:hypothetical protein